MLFLGNVNALSTECVRTYNVSFLVSHFQLLLHSSLSVAGNEISLNTSKLSNIFRTGFLKIITKRELSNRDHKQTFYSEVNMWMSCNMIHDNEVRCKIIVIVSIHKALVLISAELSIFIYIITCLSISNTRSYTLVNHVHVFVHHSQVYPIESRKCLQLIVNVIK